MLSTRSFRIIAASLGLLHGSAFAAEPAQRPEDAAAGRELFIGARPLTNGGAPCGACHAIGGEGRAFAASLGPDLSQSFVGMAPEALDGMLEDFPFPTMAPIYGRQKLTPTERAQLAGFFAGVQAKAAPGGGPIAGLASLAALACLVALALAARRGKGSTRARLLARSLRMHAQGEAR